MFLLNKQQAYMPRTLSHWELDEALEEIKIPEIMIIVSWFYNMTYLTFEEAYRLLKHFPLSTVPQDR